MTRFDFVGAHVCVLAFSCVDRDSFMALENWKKKVKGYIILEVGVVGVLLFNGCVAGLLSTVVAMVSLSSFESKSLTLVHVITMHFTPFDKFRAVFQMISGGG